MLKLHSVSELVLGFLSIARDAVLSPFVEDWEAPCNGTGTYPEVHHLNKLILRKV